MPVLLQDWCLSPWRHLHPVAQQTASIANNDILSYVCEPKLCISEVKKQLFGAMECPTTVKEVQIRLGCANWLLDFLPYHTVNMAPFIEKLCKGQETSWKVTPEMDKAWKKLIHALRNAEDLSIINYLHTLYIESDASLFGMGACMSQNTIRNGRKEKSILAYYSKRFKLEYGAHNKYTSVLKKNYKKKFLF